VVECLSESVSGKKKYMDALDGGFWQFGDDSTPTVGVTYFAGTFVRHPLALAAAKGALEIIKEGGVKQLSDLNQKAQAFVDEINLFNHQVGIPLEIVNFGSLMKPKWKSEVKEGDLLFTMLRFNGVHVYDGFPWFVNLAHTDQDLKDVIAAWKKSVATLQLHGLLPGLENLGQENRFYIKTYHQLRGPVLVETKMVLQLGLLKIQTDRVSINNLRFKHEFIRQG
jgi:hypothetical protein